MNNIYQKMTAGIVTFTLIFVACVMNSCGDFLEETSQDKAYVKTAADLDELLLGSVYMPIQIGTSSIVANWNTDGAWFYPYINIMSDEVQENITGDGSDLWGIAKTLFGYFTWQQHVGTNPEGTQIENESNDWTRTYKCINVANMVLSKIDEVGGDEATVNRIKGEAHFLRGAYYFILVNLYGKPYSKATAATDPGIAIKNTEFIEDNIYDRESVQACYDQVISDLNEAENYLAKTDHVSNYRADLTATQLLKSRVYLYMQDYEQAAAYAQKVIASHGTLFDLNTMETEYVLTQNMPEVIFTMGNGGLSWSISDYVTGYGPSEELFNAYDDNDLRKSLYVGMSEGGYRIYTKTGTNGDQSRASLSATFLLRSAEAYLNLAEAKALQGNDAEAVNALNQLRQKRYTAGTDYKVTASGGNLIAEIRNERMRELCLESHRWFDLRRYMVNDRMPYSKVIEHSYSSFVSGYFPPTYAYSTVAEQSNIYTLQANDAAYTLPIPREVLEFNRGMVDNERPARPVSRVVNY